MGPFLDSAKNIWQREKSASRKAYKTEKKLEKDQDKSIKITTESHGIAALLGKREFMKESLLSLLDKARDNLSKIHADIAIRREFHNKFPGASFDERMYQEMISRLDRLGIIDFGKYPHPVISKGQYFIDMHYGAIAPYHHYIESMGEVRESNSSPSDID